MRAAPRPRRRRRTEDSAGILAVPRDANPYQELLYAGLRRRGRPVRYLGEITGSRVVNLLAMPLELVRGRRRGYGVLHVHWVFGFVFTGADRFPALRRLGRWWFQLVLLSARALGYTIVWTAHNLVPQGQVFDDDRAARRFLVRHADLVIAHSQGALDEVSASFGAPAHGVVIPHGPIEPPGLAEVPPPSAGSPRTVLFFGRVDRYKGVEDLLAAVAGLQQPLLVQIVGHSRDPVLAGELTELAAGLEQVTLSLRFVPEEEIAELFAAADAVVYPYRKVTTSGALTLAGVAGRAIIVPDLPGFGDLPEAAVYRYAPGVEGLADALASVASVDGEELIRRGAAVKAAFGSVGWEEIAELTGAAIADAT